MVKREKNRKIQRKNLTIWFNGIFTEDGGNRSRRGYYFLYTCLYIVMVFCIFGTFFANGKSFIWASDGWKQTFQALQYYAKWLRDIVGTLVLEHKLEIPTFSFSLGYGSDIITTLHYFVIGAPFSFLTVFVPIRYMAYFYGALILLRLYLAGVSFSAYCFHMMWKTRDAAAPGQSSRAGVLVGAFVYVFCGFALHASVRHPFFITPMVWFPLILTGAEKILEGKNPLFMRLFVCLSAASNFYFFLYDGCPHSPVRGRETCYDKTRAEEYGAGSSAWQGYREFFPGYMYGCSPASPCDPVLPWGMPGQEAAL